MILICKLSRNNAVFGKKCIPYVKTQKCNVGMFVRSASRFRALANCPDSWKTKFLASDIAPAPLNDKSWNHVVIKLYGFIWVADCGKCTQLDTIYHRDVVVNLFPSFHCVIRYVLWEVHRASMVHSCDWKQRNILYYENFGIIFDANSLEFEFLACVSEQNSMTAVIQPYAQGW